MPKPSRRERRRLAEQGKLSPRRPAAPAPPTTRASMPRERTTSRMTGAALVAEELPVMSAANEYAYVKSDLRRIILLAGSLIAIMVALKFALPQ